MENESHPPKSTSVPFLYQKSLSFPRPNICLCIYMCTCMYIYVYIYIHLNLILCCTPETNIILLVSLKKKKKEKGSLGYPGGASGKEPACQCWRQKRCRYDPWVRKIHWRRA